MAYWDDFAYINPLLESSFDVGVAEPSSPLHRITDGEDDPETALIKAQDHAQLSRWVEGLPPDLKIAAGAALTGETQASMARRLNLTEAAISKRMSRLRARGLKDLKSLRRSPILH